MHVASTACGRGSHWRALLGRKRRQRSVSHSEGTKSYCTKNRRFSCRNPFGWMINFIEVLETLAICILIHLQGGFTCNEDETHTRPLLRAETFVLPAWFPFSSGLCQQGPPCHMRTSVPCLPTGSPPSSQRPAGLAFLGWPYQSKLCLPGPLQLEPGGARVCCRV